MSLKEDNTLFLEALENKNYSLVNNLLKKGIPQLIYDKHNALEKNQFSMYFNKVKFYLRDLYLDGEFYAAQKLISKFIIKRNQSSGEAILTDEDLITIGEFLIAEKSLNIHFFWNEYFKNEKKVSLLIRFTITAIQSKNTDFLSSYDNINSLFKNSLLLKNAINLSFFKTLKPDFFENLYKFYLVYNPEFNFKLNLVRELKHQLLIKDTETINTEQFRHIENIYSVYFPQLHAFKVAYGLQQSLKKKPENKTIFNEYIQEIFSLHNIDIIKEQGAFLFKGNPEFHDKFKLFTKLSDNLITHNNDKIKVNKI